MLCGQARCAPCADIAFAHFAALLGARLEQRACFYAFWPQYYVPLQPGGAPGEIAWRTEAGGLPPFPIPPPPLNPEP